MQLNANLIKQLREQRAWSQNHLADVSGLSLRTIQRIEKTGVASYESAQALAAIFDLALGQLTRTMEKEEDVLAKARRALPKIASAGFAIIATLMVIVLLPTAQARQVKLDVRFSEGDNTPIEFALVNPNGEASEVKLHDRFRLEVIPTSDNDGLFLMSVKVYENTRGDYQLISNPKVLVKELEGAMFVVKDDNYEKLTLWITPSLVP